MSGILHRNRDTLWKTSFHKQNPELVTGGAQRSQLFYCALQVCNLGTAYLQLRVGLRSSYTNNNSPPDQYMTIPLLPLSPSMAMKRILLGIQNPQGKFCAQKPSARHTLLSREQHKHYSTGTPGIPKTSAISPQMHKASFCKIRI